MPKGCNDSRRVVLCCKNTNYFPDKQEIAGIFKTP
jgi:hypothetical protein